MLGDNNEAHHNNTDINREGLGRRDLLSLDSTPAPYHSACEGTCVRVYDVTRNKPVTQFSRPTNASISEWEACAPDAAGIPPTYVAVFFSLFAPNSVVRKTPYSTL